MRQGFTFEHQAGEKKEHRKREKRRLSSLVKYSCIKDDKSIWLDSRFTKVRYNFGIKVDKNFLILFTNIIFFSLTYKFPQIWKLYHTRDTAGISVFSQIVQGAAYGFYITHGILIKDPPVVLLGVASLLQSIVLIFQYFIYSNSKEKKISINNDKIAAIDSESQVLEDKNEQKVLTR